MLQRIKDVVRHRAPESLYPVIATPYFYLHPKRDSTIIKRNGGTWLGNNLRHKTVLHYPVSQNAGRIAKPGIEKGTYYQLPGEVEVTPGDTVVDVGAYVGEFTAAIAPTAAQVLAIEPDPDSVECLNRNTNQYDHVTIERTLLDSQSGERTIQLGTDPTENSVFGVDTGSEREALTMKTCRLAAVCNQHGFDEIDFLKLEAEGAEPEILAGAGNIQIRKIAAGVGPERNGERTRSNVTELLQERGFEIRGEKRNVLFATAADD